MLDYISDHLKEIEKDMNTNIRKLSPTTKKKSRKLNKGKKHKSPKPNVDLLEKQESSLKDKDDNQKVIHDTKQKKKKGVICICLKNTQ